MQKLSNKRPERPVTKTRTNWPPNLQQPLPAPADLAPIGVGWQAPTGARICALSLLFGNNNH